MEKANTTHKERKLEKATFVPKEFMGSEYIAVGQVIPPPVPTHAVYYANPYGQPSAPVGNLSYPVTSVQMGSEESKEDARIQSLRMNAQVLTINPGPKLISREPVIVKCPHCNQTGVTTVRKQNGMLVYASSVICCLVGMGPCALVPWCIGDLKDCIHECHFCGNVVAVVKRHENL
uniref:LITAF domain-containing protein n=1 Tax=Euplotes harpa TaxID=151035 RepID=A0A7S3JPA4_9SPIT|mmetsp:Transcript_9644/g.10805  ORF Transcript_9644/g.10805 Transcript_9644/m.10805 type:complete len:176 (+) Transcript_9644:30-557(+)